MPYIIIIDKNGNIKEMNIKEYKESELFKKVNFKSPEGFLLQTKWNINLEKKNYQISIYGKINGKAGQENKYEFPPPIDSVLFFGGCVLTNQNHNHNDSISDLRISEWNAIYDKLMNGFEDLDETEDENDLDDELLDGMKIGKDGYALDDFIVDDDEIDYDNLSLEEEDETKEEYINTKQNKSKINNSKNNSSIKKKKTTQLELNDTIENNEYLDYQSELSEEEYL